MKQVIHSNASPLIEGVKTARPEVCRVHGAFRSLEFRSITVNPCRKLLPAPIGRLAGQADCELFRILKINRLLLLALFSGSKKPVEKGFCGTEILLFLDFPFCRQNFRRLFSSVFF